MSDNIKILIADDNYDFAMTLMGYLEREEGMEIVGRAKDGSEAYQMIMEKCPDVVLLDMIMPHVDGLGVLERVNDSKLEKRPLCYNVVSSGTRQNYAKSNKLRCAILHSKAI